MNFSADSYIYKSIFKNLVKPMHLAVLIFPQRIFFFVFFDKKFYLSGLFYHKSILVSLWIF